MKKILPPSVDLALLLLRAGTGAMMAYTHGWPKLIAFADKFHTFANPIGLGPEVSYVLTVFAEFFCSLLIALGLFTRAASVPLIILLLVIIFRIHWHDPWGKKEFVLLYLLPFLTALLAGAGRYSLDAVWRKK